MGPHDRGSRHFHQAHFPQNSPGEGMDFELHHRISREIDSGIASRLAAGTANRDFVRRVPALVRTLGLQKGRRKVRTALISPMDVHREFFGPAS